MFINYGLDNVFFFNPGDWNSLKMIVKYAAFRFLVPTHNISDSDINWFFRCRNFNVCFHVFAFFLVGPLGLEPRTDGL